MRPIIRLPFLGEFPVTFKFGENPDWYVKRFGYPHNGIDWGMPVGTPIVACADGIISYADSVPDSDGCGVIISHDFGRSLYWHLSEVRATPGQSVKKGECVGLSGATGYATGPHLHFGVLYPVDSPPNMRGWVNPLNYIDDLIPQIPAPVIVQKTYRVGFGDTLWKIAEKFYGEGYFWPKIYEANRDKIKHPALIYPFQVLRIP